MDFSKNCVFIDVATFHINMKSSRVWAPKGKVEIDTIPVKEAHSHSIIGSILSVGIVNVSIHVSKEPPKIRKFQVEENKKNT